MIDPKQGNLLEADAEALVNTVNCVGIMGKGIALQFKQAFPDNYRQYARACKTGQVHLGAMFIVPTDTPANPRYIINFPTKDHWRGKSRLEDIESGLAALVEDVRRLAIHSIAIPALGCHNGGLDWNEVRPRIVAAFEPLPDVHVLLFGPHATPSPEAMPIGTVKPSLTRARALFILLMDLYRQPGYQMGRLEIQKLAYFLQVAGEPLRLDFVKDQYGPYAENLNHVLQRLEGHYMRGYGDRNTRAEIQLLPGAIDEARKELDQAPDARERLERVRCLIEGFETPAGMELLATVHWVAQHNLGAAEDPDIAVLGVQGWSKRKKERFTPAQIHKAWQRLRDEAWLMAGEPVTPVLVH